MTLQRELWKFIPEFPNYQISTFGNVYNYKQDQMMRTSINNFGNPKITLTLDDGSRHTRSVAQMVAEAFVSPPEASCDQVVVLDGNFENMASENLVWRPTHFAWKYTRQLRVLQPNHYRNLRVVNVTTGIGYNSIIEAAMNEGLLFIDIWRSTFNHTGTYPEDSVFEVMGSNI